MSKSDNNRTYYRVDDEVFLQVKKIEISDETNIELYFNEFRQSTLINARFHQQRTAMAPVLREISARDAAVANYTNMLSSQIDLLADRLMMSSIFPPNEPMQPVNLSAEGMRFSTSIALNVGDYLEMIFALMPSGDYIPAIAKVVRIDHDDIDVAPVISVNFDYWNDDDKELVIHHVLFLQRRYLQEKRLSG